MSHLFTVRLLVPQTRLSMWQAVIKHVWHDRKKGRGGRNGWDEWGERRREGRREDREIRERLCLLRSCYTLDSFKYVFLVFTVPAPPQRACLCYFRGVKTLRCPHLPQVFEFPSASNTWGSAASNSCGCHFLTMGQDICYVPSAQDSI